MVCMFLLCGNGSAGETVGTGPRRDGLWEVKGVGPNALFDELLEKKQVLLTCWHLARLTWVSPPSPVQTLKVPQRFMAQC